MSRDAAALIEMLALRALAEHARPVVIGVCGAQGSGKSTASAEAAARLDAQGLPTAVLSIDDLYLHRAQRVRLARDVHPLLRTRGVPGTHDVALGLQTIGQIRQGDRIPLPRFDKGSDDRLPKALWPLGPPNCRVLLFEGWCVGARPQPEEALASPINTLEATEDPDGRWRHYVNAQLDGAYRPLFGEIDRLLLLAAPDFGVVRRWRTQQEHELRRTNGSGMTDAEVVRFIAHYERLTRHVLQDMPGRADAVAWLDRNRGIAASDISVVGFDLSI